MRAKASSILAAALFGVAMAAPAVHAQDFPARPVHVLIGAGPDNLARIVGEQLNKIWKQPIVIEPRPGAGGQIAAQAVANAPPDGYLLLNMTPSYVINMALGTAKVDVLTAFAPFSLSTLATFVLVVQPDSPVKSVADLVARAKERPGQLNCASSGIGTPPHFACEMFNKLAGVQTIHVPHRDTNAAMTSLLGGHVQFFFAVSTTAIPQVKSGTVRALAVTSAERSKLFPDLPTMMEAGVRDFDITGWTTFVAPIATPKPVLAALNAAFNQAHQDPTVQERILAIAQEPQPPMTPEAVDVFVKKSAKHWADMVDLIGMPKKQ
ncbi:MAG: tripartite tricarboxylate transporter substrate binding protein [Hyphomicrobiales bacterium]|nr:tripartite tricarboxylate transporter substrate binding protein [Hyphomicrobiales bacterium]